MKPPLLRPKKALPFLAAIFLSSPLSGEEAPPPPSLEKNTKWEVRVLPFDLQSTTTGKIPQEAVENFRKILVEKLQDIKEHLLSQEEKESLKSYLIEKSIRTVNLAIDKAWQEQSLLFFENDSSAAKNLEKKKEEEQSLKEKKILLLSEDPERISVPEKMEVSIQTLDQKGPAPPFSNPGVWISGTITPINENYFDFEISVENTIDRRSQSLLRRQITKKELPSFLDQASDLLRSQILGRPWAHLKVKTSPAEASIYWQDRYLGSGMIDDKTMTVSEGTLTVSATGFVSHTETVNLVEETPTTVDIELEKLARESIIIASFPPGAEVFKDSYLMGKTPLEIPIPLSPSRLTLQKEGFSSIVRHIDALSPPYININLPPLSRPNLEDLRKQKKRRFFQSATLFDISLIAPILLFGIAGNLRQRADALGAAGSSSAGQSRFNYQLANTFFWTSAGISLAAFIYGAYRLYDYLSFVNKAAK